MHLLFVRVRVEALNHGSATLERLSRGKGGKHGA